MLKVKVPSLLLLVLSVNCQKTRKPNIFIMPKGFIGKVTVNFQQPTGIDIESTEARIFNIPNNGVLNVRNRMSDGWASDQFCYSGDKLPIPLGFIRGVKERPDKMHVYGYAAVLDNSNKPLGNHIGIIFYVGTKEDSEKINVKANNSIN